MKLLIRNLARTTSEAELLALFSEQGNVQACTLVLDNETGKSKGFGFVEMADPTEAEIAIKTLNGKKIAGNKIRVKQAAENPLASHAPTAASASIWPEVSEQPNKPSEQD
ncbi:RNA recognition motif domain-containing protein [Agarivorans sp. Z349TD_8]|uniref:RNA recognition motif domain-containing protein n=1 Tax=Agarivorans sp. Z349TD_8 TaxID=3421434 RepID=UPI003D7CC08E